MYQTRNVLFDVDDCVQPPTTRKQSRLPTNRYIKYMTDFYSNAENEDEDDVDQTAALRSSSYTLEIEIYIKQGSDKSSKAVDTLREEGEKYDPLPFSKKM